LNSVARFIIAFLGRRFVIILVIMENYAKLRNMVSVMVLRRKEKEEKEIKI
jgi:hypothetical protein